jgi:diphthamide biosynthesis protein 7
MALAVSLAVRTTARWSIGQLTTTRLGSSPLTASTSLYSGRVSLVALCVHTPVKQGSGGDDCKFKTWDRRQGLHQPVSMNKRFEGGVTAIQCHPSNDRLVGVGRRVSPRSKLSWHSPWPSYDSHFRIFDKRNMQREVFNVDVGGGIWRVKWQPQSPNRLALATMHDGYKLLDLQLDGEVSLKSMEAYRKHESLAYGLDWNRSGSTLASCSFYDHLITLWSPS